MSAPKFGNEKTLPDQHVQTLWLIYQPQRPEYRNFEAFDFVISELRLQVREHGAANAELERHIIVDRAVAQGIPEHDVEIALTVMVMSGHLTERDGVIRFELGHERHPLPSVQTKQILHQPRERKDLARAYPLVKALIEQRGTAAFAKPEPLLQKPSFIQKFAAEGKWQGQIDELFAEYDEIARDVLASRYQSFQANLKRGLRFLDGTGPFAAPILQKLESSANFSTWFEPYRIGMFAGFSGVLEWPDQREKELGTQLHLMRQFASDAVSPGEFALTILRTGSNINDGIREINGQIFQPLSSALRRYLMQEVRQQSVLPVPLLADIPTADGYVKLDHNSPQYGEAIARLEETIQAVSNKNDYPDQEDKEQRLGELTAGKSMLKSARLRVVAFTALVGHALFWLIKTFAGDWVGKVAELAWNASKALWS